MVIHPNQDKDIRVRRVKYDRATSVVNGNANYIVTADFNGDGKLGVAVANSTGGNVIVLPGNGDGTLQPGAYYQAGISPIALLIGDLNLNGKPDLLTVNTDGGNVTVFVRTQSGS